MRGSLAKNRSVAATESGPGARPTTARAIGEAGRRLTPTDVVGRDALAFRALLEGLQLLEERHMPAGGSLNSGVEALEWRLYRRSDELGAAATRRRDSLLGVLDLQRDPQRSLGVRCALDVVDVRCVRRRGQLDRRDAGVQDRHSD
ncbi:MULTISPECIES: hypothetical protein [Microbacterium]|uniref:DUF222 domain-containing protein n=1 Tax=Microbacterium wangchenii TaxID=2541726 RepID=A0ABX5SY34_9MICO|nr:MULTISPECIES: hypothetical protein [Microbacterium]MCK6065732.1 hypothetical protein [Microbacterium sp. EYE_512]QBR90052.1 hypothetical protein E4K62_15990 [Microbacterium wangchenii]TXK11888.1 hypothetical protein FVP99_15980 [Microbacterium wangchenii]